MKYWLNLYTWKTWQEFVQSGKSVTGFRDGRWKTVQKIQSGDVFLCYMTGISRFFAIQEITDAVYKDDAKIWEEDVFPCRVPVRTVLSLDPEFAVPVTLMREHLSFFQNGSSPHSWTGFFRSSPSEIKKDDAEVIVAALHHAQQNPFSREVDQRKLERRVHGYATKSGVVTIPENDDYSNGITETTISNEDTDTTHEEIQWLLLHLGQEMGMDLWVANNDRGKDHHGNYFKQLSRLRTTLPIQFDAATNRTIELIDVLWLRDNSIVAAFEIEHTTSIYSGLLRMADLVTMQPNINIPLFIVAPDERREKVEREINRPVFSRALKQPLPQICRYIAYSTLKEKINHAEAGGLLKYLRPEFLDEIAESVEIDEY
ncbi:MAG: hypothetical protein OHK0046_41310 [Anaerolineae bacterium]